MALRIVTAVWLPALLAAGAAAEYLDSRQDQVYRSWRGLQYVCRCDPAGSVGRSCDIISGQCTCHPHVTGPSCDRCQAGYYNLRPGIGCRRCDCATPGSEWDRCDSRTGQCYCKPGVGGARCTTCLPGYFRLSATGCQECGRCGQPGHRCDPDTGQCTCAPNTDGASCERCARGYWGLHPITGCKRCDCGQLSSDSADCDPWTGRCGCVNGFGGRRCDRCALGFYSFPRCTRCQCDRAGTAGCDGRGNCPCAEGGRCHCKTNVRGARCDQCAPDTFSLSADNPDGCTACFCFTRSGQCTQSEFSWVPLYTVETNRTVIFEYDVTSETYETFPVVPWITDEICYIHLTLPDDRAVTLTPGQTRLNVTNSLRVIPGQTGDVTLGLGVPLDTPIYWQLPREFLGDKVGRVGGLDTPTYWQLPREFLGDKVRSYNGQLRFRLRSSGGSRPFPGSILATYPLVQLQGNTRLVLEYFPPEQQTGADRLQQVKFHESLWRRKGDSGSPVTREMLMVALQNTQQVLIRATEAVDTQQTEITDISWDIAEPTYSRSHTPALGIERCACPGQYNGSSCQDPSIGFYRTYTENHREDSQIIIDLIGDVVECRCNGRTASCDPDTGFCQNCTDNTAGRHCDICAAGYYGDPSALGGCRRCLCPTAAVSNAYSCTAYYGNTARCQCKPGYYGERCDRCEYGYFGDARDPSVGCAPCSCDPTGSVGRYCDTVTGQCRCRSGWLGLNCARCPYRYALTTYGCQECQDGCVEVLFEELDTLADTLAALNVSGGVVAPWRRLYAISNETQRHEEALTEYIGTQRTLNAMNTLTESLETFADNVLMQTEELLASVPNYTNATQTLMDDVRAIAESIVETRVEAEETVEELLKYARGNSPSASLDQALADATAILEKLQKRNFTAAQQMAERELAEVHRLRERVESLAINGTAQQVALSKLENMRQRMQDMLKLIEQQARQPVREAEKLLAKVRGRLGRRAERQQVLGNETQLTENLLANTSLLLLQLRRLYDQAQGHTIDLSDLRDKLQLSNASLQLRLAELSQLSGDFGAELHAEQLTRQADELARLFQATRQEANMSLAAAHAYQEIVDALQAAREAAEEASQAAQKAFDQAYPRDTDSLVSLGTQSKAISEELRKSSQELLSQVESLSDKMDVSKKRLQQVNETMQDVRARNDAIRRKLKELNITELSRSVADAAEMVRAVQAKTAAVSRRVDVVLSGVDTVLRPGLTRLETAAEEDVSNATRLVAEADRTISQAAKLAGEVERTAASSGQLGAGVDLKLQQLRNKILKSRQAASNIRVSLTANGTSCSRRYRAADLQPSTASSLRLSYAISQPDIRDALLLYIGATGQQSDFLAVEMVDRKIRFLWNNGRDTKVVTHPLELGTNDEQLLSDGFWYSIEANRIGNLGRLTVRPMDGGAALSGNDTVSGVSTAGFSLLDLTPEDPVFIGAPPAPVHRSLAAKRFAGCLDGVSINGQPLGLWNFQSTRDCGACRVGPSDQLVVTPESSFDGAGYVELPPLPFGSHKKNYFPLEMWVRTFDSDALLFLVANDKKGQFFSLEMRDGHLVLRVGFSDTDVLVVKSKDKYNTGNWTRVEATHYNDKVILKVNEDDAKQGAFNPVGGDRPASFDLDLVASKLYVGGVPPDFDRRRWSQPTFVPLLGCVKNVLAVIAQNLKVGNSTGATNGCRGQLLKTVGFRGDGYLEIDSYGLKRNSSFGFSFKTGSSDGLLLISTFAGKVLANSTDLQEYYTLGLVGGRLVLQMNGGNRKEQLLLAANGTFSNNVFHTVSVVKTGRRVELRVADRLEDSGRFASRLQVPSAGGLFLGGLPADVTSPAAVPRAFNGCITDVILEDSLIVFNDTVRHERVAIGRCDGALLRGPAMERMATEPASTSCHQLKQVTLEDRALKFGDNLQSHVFKRVSKKEFQTNFVISLNFRTFYPNGLLLYTGVDKKQRKNKKFFTLALRNGDVVFNAKRGSKTMELSTRGNLNDGQWKMVTLKRRGRNYTLQVDGRTPVGRRGLGRLRAGNGLYLGGLPNTSYVDKRPLGPRKLDSLKTERFKGCIRQLRLQERVYDLTAADLRQTSFGVGLCNAHVEQGTFFAGDAYATYDESFQFGDEVNLAVSFRTSALNGVLISGAHTDQSGPGPRLALALELSDGEVVFSVHNGGSEPIRARMKFPTKFSVCDNRWHSVKAHYVQNQARLRVDKYPETYGVRKDAQRILPGQFPLYIGGLPDSAWPSNSILLQQDNFKGCIRNIEINRMRRDWTDMTNLTQVLLNSCPVDK